MTSSYCGECILLLVLGIIIGLLLIENGRSRDIFVLRYHKLSNVDVAEFDFEFDIGYY